MREIIRGIVTEIELRMVDLQASDLVILSLVVPICFMSLVLVLWVVQEWALKGKDWPNSIKFAIRDASRIVGTILISATLVISGMFYMVEKEGAKEDKYTEVTSEDAFKDLTSLELPLGEGNLSKIFDEDVIVGLLESIVKEDEIESLKEAADYFDKKCSDGESWSKKCTATTLKFMKLMDRVLEHVNRTVRYSVRDVSEITSLVTLVAVETVSKIPDNQLKVIEKELNEEFDGIISKYKLSDNSVNKYIDSDIKLIFSKSVDNYFYKKKIHDSAYSRYAIVVPVDDTNLMRDYVSYLVKGSSNNVMACYRALNSMALARKRLGKNRYSLSELEVGNGKSVGAQVGNSGVIGITGASSQKTEKTKVELYSREHLLEELKSIHFGFRMETIDSLVMWGVPLSRLVSLQRIKVSENFGEVQSLLARAIVLDAVFSDCDSQLTEIASFNNETMNDFKFDLFMARIVAKGRFLKNAVSSLKLEDIEKMNTYSDLRQLKIPRRSIYKITPDL
ncbi:hypothetical protein [Mesorhizobium sp. SP-1A]|uniref:hypothetical protein n=1 Tax=Mesorhizobium sp. SP-1A TaxID=3077840 RepID=UPI0028F6DC29|nr:hypothetical protein [Mesorhizobium sp. SP-1A]